MSQLANRPIIQKSQPTRSNKLTSAAKGRDCTRCHINNGTTVFCHAPSVGHGMALKSADWWGADLCHECHDIMDGRSPILTIAQRWAEWLPLIHATMGHRIKAGLIQIAGARK